MRAVVIVSALIGAAATAWFAPDEQGAVSAPARPAVAASRAAAVAPNVFPVASERLKIRSREGEPDLGTAFAEPARQAKPVAAMPAGVVQAAPSEPPAPPLPFKFLGHMVEQGKPAYFLQYGERALVLRPGETVDQLYSFDSAGAGALSFTYLPLKQQQTLIVGEVN